MCCRGLIGIRELKELLRPDSSFLSKQGEMSHRFSGPATDVNSQNRTKKRETLLSVQSLGAPSERCFNITRLTDAKTVTKESGISEENERGEEVRHFEIDDANVYSFKDNGGIHDGTCLSDVDSY